MKNTYKGKGYLISLLNTMSREAGLGLEGKLNRRLAAILGKPVTKAQLWPLLAAEYARRKAEGSLPSKSKDRKQISPPSKDFYESREWRSLRYQALKKSDGCCSLCGQSKRDHGIVLHVDHIKPRSKRPDLALNPTNLQVLCEACNLGKSNRDDTDWSVGQNVVWLDKINWREY